MCRSKLSIRQKKSHHKYIISSIVTTIYVGQGIVIKQIKNNIIVDKSVAIITTALKI